MDLTKRCSQPTKVVTALALRQHSAFEKRHVDGNRWTESCGSGSIIFIGGIRHH